MADQIANRGRLIAIDGSRGRAVAREAERLARELKARGVECAISRWDASGLFGELVLGRAPQRVSPRTLTLLFAADLAFRLRWEIRPALESGGVVIAAPYVDTAVAFGAAFGLPERWVRELLRFAPPPSTQGLIGERKIERGWKARLDRGYPEYCAAMIEPGAARSSKKARRRMIQALEAARGRHVFNLSAKGRTELAKAIGSRKAVRGSQRATPSRSRGRARNART